MISPSARSLWVGSCAENSCRRCSSSRMVGEKKKDELMMWEGCEESEGTGGW